MKMVNLNSKITKALLWLVLLILCLILLKSKEYILSIFISTLIYTGVAVAWDIMGLSGKISFGQAAFFGIGAYTSMILSANGVNLLLALIVGGLVAGFFAITVGIPFLRLRGPYFAIGTLGLANVVYILALVLKKWTRGAAGFALPKSVFINRSFSFYYILILITVILVALIHYWMCYTKVGVALKAIHDDEDAALSVGVNTIVYELIAFGISALLTGILGAFYALYITYISPSNVFSSSISIGAVAMAVFGGVGTTIGPIIGGIFLSFLSEILRNYVSSNFSLLLYGIAIVGTMLFLPGGLISITFRRTSKRQNQEGANNDARV
jgi:branched-chain amino acid transport system permease protein